MATKIGFIRFNKADHLIKLPLATLGLLGAILLGLHRMGHNPLGIPETYLDWQYSFWVIFAPFVAMVWLIRFEFYNRELEKFELDAICLGLLAVGAGAAAVELLDGIYYWVSDLGLIIAGSCCLFLLLFNLDGKANWDSYCDEHDDRWDITNFVCFLLDRSPFALIYWLIHRLMPGDDGAPAGKGGPPPVVKHKRPAPPPTPPKRAEARQPDRSGDGNGDSRPQKKRGDNPTSAPPPQKHSLKDVVETAFGEEDGASRAIRDLARRITQNFPDADSLIAALGEKYGFSPDAVRQFLDEEGRMDLAQLIKKAKDLSPENRDSNKTMVLWLASQQPAPLKREPKPEPAVTDNIAALVSNAAGGDEASAKQLARVLRARPNLRQILDQVEPPFLGGHKQRILSCEPDKMAKALLDALTYEKSARKNSFLAALGEAVPE